MKPTFAVTLCIALALGLSSLNSQVQADVLDENFPVYVILQLRPVVAPFDPPYLIRATATATNAWFDAIAPYHPTAVGLYSNLGRRPEAERTTRNKNIAMAYATLRVLNSLFPTQQAQWSAIIAGVGLDPNDNSLDLTTPIGIGNAAGKAIVAVREQDGMNQLGNIDGKNYNRRRYEDYTGYAPVNTAYELNNPGRWQPNTETDGNGVYFVQQHVSPQYGQVNPIALHNANTYNSPKPVASNPKLAAAYKAQVDDVLNESANLNDHRKMIAEFFDDKLASLGGSTFFLTAVHNLTMEDFVILDFMSNAALFDAGIVAWRQKIKWDAVRPFSAIRHIYENDQITAWGGPGQGTVNNITGREWRSYLRTAAHADYPSGSACFCAAQSQVNRLYFNSDNFGFQANYPAGSSKIEPGITPSANIVLGPWATHTAFEQECALSRVYGGVHFRAAVFEGLQLCRSVGTKVFEKVTRLLAGNPN